jgi:hypothetical protein
MSTDRQNSNAQFPSDTELSTTVSTNLFLSLEKWAKRGGENYCTEGLVYLLRLMLQEHPNEAKQLIFFLTGDLIGSNEDAANDIYIDTHINAEKGGRPDIEIRYKTRIAWIEVKVDASVTEGQLKKYREELNSRTNQGRLILLWRGGDKLTEDNQPDIKRRWIELSEKLRECRCRIKSHSSKTKIILDDYLYFLGNKQMALNLVRPHIADSIQNVATLLQLIKESLIQSNCRPDQANDDNSLGYFVYKNENLIGWIGFDLREPRYLYYTTHYHKIKIDMDKARTIRVEGEMLFSEFKESKYWALCIDLDHPDCFPTQSPQEQVDWLKATLLDKCVEVAEKIIIK